MTILGIILGLMSIACIILKFTSEWIDTHDKSNAKVWQLKTVIAVHMTLSFPAWVIQGIASKIKERTKQNERVDKRTKGRA